MNKKFIALGCFGAIVLFIIIVAMWVVGIHNGMVKKQEIATTEWSNVESAYQRRSDLIGNTIDELVQRYQPLGLRECIVTDISRDGTLEGPSTALYQRLQEAYPAVSFTVSGGISRLDDIRALNALGLRKVIVGKAFYEQRITLEDIALWSQNASSPA